MENAVTGKRLEEILAEQGLSTGFVYGAPQDESWDGVVDREIKLEPTKRVKWLMDNLFYQSYSTANTGVPLLVYPPPHPENLTSAPATCWKCAGPKRWPVPMRTPRRRSIRRICCPAARPAICAADSRCPG